MNYSIEHGCYVLRNDGDILLSGLPQVGVALSVETDGDKTVIMHKHGDPKLVFAWAADAKKRFIAADFQSMADEIQVFIGQFPIEDLNRMIENTSYPKKFHEKLIGNTLERELEVTPVEPETGISH